MAQSDLLSRASFSIQGIWVLLPCTTLCTWVFLPCTLFFSFGYGLFCLCTWAFLTFTLVCRHFCPSQKAQIPKSHKIVTLMLICHIYIRDFTVLPHNKYIWRFINLFLAWFFTASQKFSRLFVNVHHITCGGPSLSAWPGGTWWITHWLRHTGR